MWTTSHRRGVVNVSNSTIRNKQATNLRMSVIVMFLIYTAKVQQLFEITKQTGKNLYQFNIF